MSETPAQAFVQRKFKLARTRFYAGRGHRCYLFWRHEPTLSWWANPDDAWAEAMRFLNTYPNNSLLNPKDPARKRHAVQRPRATGSHR